MLNLAMVVTLLASGVTIKVDEFPLPERSPGLRASAGWIATGPDGNLWFLENFEPGGLNQVGRITPEGEITEFPVRGFARDLGLREIVAGPDGNLWFVAFHSPKVGRITTDGEITLFDVPPDFCNGPTKIIAGPDGNLWFTAVNNQAIGRITPEGKVTPFPISPPNRFTLAGGIAAGPDGNVWYTAKRHHGLNPPKIEPYDLIGRITPEGRIDEFEVPEPEIVHPGLSPLLTGIITGRDRNLWFTHQGGGVLRRMAPDGRIDASLACPHNISAMTVGPGGNLWFASAQADKLGRVTRKGAVVEFDLPKRSPAISIAVDRDDRLWLPILDGGRILRVTLVREERQTP